MGRCLFREIAAGASYQATPPNPPWSRMGLNHNRFLTVISAEAL
jgi:hypothetical protein